MFCMVSVSYGTMKSGSTSEYSMCSNYNYVSLQGILKFYHFIVDIYSTILIVRLSMLGV